MVVNEFKITSWNAQGANDSSKRNLIKTFLRCQKLDVFCLQETKMHVMLRLVRTLGSGRFLEWEALDASGSTSGALVV